MIHHRQKITLDRGLKDLRKLELFVEKLCDQFNIYNNYFGIILYSLTEVYRVSIPKTKEAVSVKLVFNATAKGFVFQFFGSSFDDEFVDVLRNSCDLEEKVELSDLEQTVAILKRVTDGMHLEENDSIRVFFDIASIHFELSQNRVMLLNGYFDKVRNASNILTS